MDLSLQPSFDAGGGCLFYAKLAKLSPPKNILMFLCQRKVMEKYPLNDFRVGILTRLQVFELKHNYDDNILLQISSNCVL